MKGHQPLVSVAEAQMRAKRRVPRAVYDSLVAGTEQGLTVADNRRSRPVVWWK